MPPGQDGLGGGDGGVLLAEHPAEVPEGGGQVVRHHAPEGAVAAPGGPGERGEHRPEVRDHGGPQFGAQSVVAGHGDVAGHGHVAGQGDVTARAQGERTGGGVQPEVGGVDGRHSAGEVPGAGDQQAGRPGVVVEQPGGGDVRSRGTAVLVGDAGLRSGQDGGQRAFVGGELGSGVPAVGGARVGLAAVQEAQLQHWAELHQPPVVGDERRGPGTHRGRDGHGCSGNHWHSRDRFCMID
ncbi:hypothetical protein ACWGKU_07225 [Kitasatospora sp. NPDC054768]